MSTINHFDNEIEDMFQIAREGKYLKEVREQTKYYERSMRNNRIVHVKTCNIECKEWINVIAERNENGSAEIHSIFS